MNELELMSFDINWAQLVSDDSINESIKEFLDQQFQRISLPSFIDNLSVTDFSLGSSPPEITIRHIGDPFDDFYEDEGEDEEKEKKTVYTQNGVGDDSNSSDEEDEDYDGDRSNDLSIITEDPNVQGFSDDSNRNRLVGPPQAPPTDLKRSRTALDPISLIMSNNNLNYMHNYNMNYVGLGNLNATGTHTGTDTPTNILNQNPYASLKSNQSSYYKNKEQPRPADLDSQTKGGFKLTSKDTCSSRSENDIQIIAEFKYNGDLHLELTVNLLVNYPSPNFISLPIKLHITDLVIHSIITIAYLKGSAFTSFLCDVNDVNSDYFSSTHNSTLPESSNGVANTGGNFVDYITGPINRERIDIIKKVKIESEIGEVEQNALRNVGKVERFLVEQLRTLIRDEFAWPSWVCFDLNDDEDDEDDEFNQETHPEDQEET